MVYFLMGEETLFQPLTREDKITVVFYRLGIVCSTLLICLAAAIGLAVTARAEGLPAFPVASLSSLLLALYASIGLSVFFIHLYVGKFHRFLKRLYIASLFSLALLFAFGHGDPLLPLFRVPPLGTFLLVPLSLCLGFVTAKEAFCFQLLEGYLLALLMPSALALYAFGLLAGRNAAIMLAVVSALLVLFTLRKVFMPIHYDIGDKSAYQP